MFRKILVPLDGSDLSASILPIVTQLTTAFKGSVTLMYAYPFHPSRTSGVLTTASGTMVATEYLNLMASALEKKGLQAATLEMYGEPAAEIARAAVDVGFDLIAMSTHGFSGVKRWVLGSTADKVLQLASTPLLLRRPDAHEERSEPELQCVVTPLDGSVLGEAALAHAEALAKRLAAPIHLVEVAPTSATMAYVLTTFDPGLLDAKASEAQAYLKKKASALEEGSCPVECHVLRGSAADVIIDYAEKIPGSLIAMSTHGRSGIGRWVLGSVADRVVRASSRPVLIVRPPNQ